MFNFILDYYNHYYYIAKNPCSDYAFYNFFHLNTIMVNCSFGEISAYVMMGVPPILTIFGIYLLYKLLKNIASKLKRFCAVW